jgi:Ribonucleotide reductase, alpha subunit
MGTIPDSLDGIFDMLKEAALTMQQGGGIGYDFSTLRPEGAPVKGVAADASGPLTFMDVWDAMCKTIMSAGTRRGAMMATMRCDHPDIEKFIEAKRDPNRLRMFNVSVLVTDEFMRAVEKDEQFPLRFNGETYKTVSARSLWDKITLATYHYAEPGVIFIDRINQDNNLSYCETISATNPCGEQPLPPYGACLLGSINLAALLTDDFEIDRDALRETVSVAVRMMDNVVDASRFPLPAQEAEAKAKRRIGLGVTGLADALALGGITYGSDELSRGLMKSCRPLP